MPKRYFLDKSGAQMKRIQGRPGEGHIAIAKEVLQQQGRTATGKQDYYVQMFKLKYVRVVEHDDGSVEAEHCAALTATQKRVLEDLQREGKKVVLKKTSLRSSGLAL
jgi:hypothetical protein